MDLGSCGKQHVTEMQEQYGKELEKGKSLGYEQVLVVELERIIDEVERKIRQQQYVGLFSAQTHIKLW